MQISDIASQIWLVRHSDTIDRNCLSQFLAVVLDPKMGELTAEADPTLVLRAAALRDDPEQFGLDAYFQTHAVWSAGLWNNLAP